MKKQQLIDLYVAAAELIRPESSGWTEFSCVAIKWALPGKAYDTEFAIALYLQTMQMTDHVIHTVLWLEDDACEHRILMLLLMAEWIRTDYKEPR